MLNSRLALAPQREDAWHRKNRASQNGISSYLYATWGSKQPDKQLC